MLQTRKLKIVLVCLTIAITQSEQHQRNQGQTQGRGYTQRQLIYKEQQEREHKAREVLKYINSEADACTNFYDFACGNWLQEQNTDRANKGDLISVQSEMEKLTNQQLQAILNEPISSRGAKVAKDFYQLCLREPASSPAQRQFIRRFVVHNGGLPDIEGTGWKPDYDWINIIADLRRNYNMDILIGLTIDTNNKLYIIEEPQTTLLPPNICNSLATRQIDENDQVFDEIQDEIKENLKNWFQLYESNALRIAGAIIRFEYDLCKYMRFDEVTTTPMDKEEQQQDLHNNRKGVYNFQHSFKSFYDMYKINLKDFVDKNKVERVTLNRLNLRSEEYFQQLSKIADKGLQASFAHYIMYRALSEINFPLNQRNDQRPFYCTNQVMRYLPQVLSKLYNERMHNEEAQRDVQYIFTNIKKAFSNANTKNTIKQNLDTLYITYPSYSGDEDVSRELPLHDRDYWHRLQTIMMYNANQTIQALQVGSNNDPFLEGPTITTQKKSNNYELVVGSGLLQKPLYSKSYSKSLKYSSIGVVIAREINKIFYNQVLQQNPSKNLASDSPAMESFAEASECFRAQISNYLHNNPLVFRNATKLREMMLETSALNMAFSAYLNWLENPNTNLRLETLPDINFTNTQLFFINYAQTRCAARKQAEFAPEYLPLYRHTFAQYDINGPLSNNVEFARDFNCELGSDMNLDEKCLMY